jgi:RNA polymerase sigma-70 factor (ECF subfamily)
VQDVSDAEEVTQDVFIEVFRSASKFRNKSSISTWVYQITVRKSLDMLKYKSRAKRNGKVLSIFGSNSSEIDAPDFDHPGILVENQESARALFSVIYQLPDKQKTAFILSYIEELPQKEVAEIMQLKLKAVESLLQRAKQNIKEKVKKVYPERRNLK